MFGCNHEQGSDSMEKKRSQLGQVEKSINGMLASAASPGVEQNDGIVGNIDLVFRKTINLINEASELSDVTEHAFKDPEFYLVGAYDQPNSEEETTVLAYRMGRRGFNDGQAHLLVWQENNEWKVQLYPKAENNVTRQRYQYFKEQGENCPVGCGSGFSALQQDGEYMLVVVDLSAVGTAKNEEVHLLKRINGSWSVVWVPTPDYYRYQKEKRGNITVELPKEGIDSFAVHYPNHSRINWQRIGDTYKHVKTSR